MPSALPVFRARAAAFLCSSIDNERVNMETTKAILIELQKSLLLEYVAQLNALPFKKSIREAIISGYTDGCRQGIQHTVQMLGVTVKE